MHNNDTIIVMGRSGSGKGTQVQLLKDYLNSNRPEMNIFHFESGNHFRNFIDQPGYTSELMREILGKGILAPDFITEWFLADAFVKNMTREDQVVIIDGFPRTVNQAHTLDSAMKYYHRSNIKVLHIRVSEEEVRNRMIERGRTDDQKIEVINNRITWYNENVLPTLDYMRSQPHYEIIDIDGERSVEDVHSDIIATLGLLEK